jgi:hypothetical protein
MVAGVKLHHHLCRSMSTSSWQVHGCMHTSKPVLAATVLLGSVHPLLALTAATDVLHVLT